MSDFLQLIETAQTELSKGVRESFEDFNITIEQFRVLQALKGQKTGLSADKLALKSNVLGPSLSRMLKKLEKDDLISRKIAPKDQRINILKLTRKGAGLSRKLETRFNKTITSPESRTKTESLVEKLCTQLKQAS